LSFGDFAILGSVEATVHFVKWLSVVIAAVSSAGCAPVWTTDGMYLVRGRAGALFLTPSSLDLSGYRGVVLDEIQISTKRRSRDLKPSEEERLKGFFSRRLEYVFERNGWPVVENPGEDVLRVRLAVKGLELERFRNPHRGKIIINGSMSRIAIVLELRDAVKKDRRLLFGDNRNLPFGIYNGSDPVSIKRVEDAFFDFSIDIRRRLNQVKRGEFPPPQLPPPLSS
jgi:hypothetical protein